MTTAAPERLWSYALFAGAMSAAGVPLYLYAPKFYFDNYGVSLATLGLALFFLRLLDVVQDPLLGQLSARLTKSRSAVICIAALILSAAMESALPPAPRRCLPSFQPHPLRCLQGCLPV